ncbi:MAG: protein kinase [Vicinamibacteria bacterium]
MSPQVGTAFASYRIDEQLGEGGMATVYKAWEPGLDRYVALKILSSEFARDKMFGKRFDREAKMVAKLEHPNIIPIFAYGIEDGVPWMAMRSVAGGNLASLAGGHPMPLRRAIEIVESVADALDYAHQRGVIHRDVKPQNILLDEAGRVYLVDFGIARMTEGAQRLTQAGLVAGTPQYMAPEQASGGELDEKVDIYALGVVAYELLTGATPFRAENPMDVLLKHISDPVPVPARGSVPDGVIEPLLKCLAKRPEDRWPTAAAFAAALLEGAGGKEAPRSEDEYAPTMAMERPDFSNMPAPRSKAYEPTVLSSRAPISPKPRPSEPAPYEPTVLVARATVPPASGTSEKPRYEPTILAPRPNPPRASTGPKPGSGAGSPTNGSTSSSGQAGAGRKILAAVVLGLALLFVASGSLVYLWWAKGQAASQIEPSPAVVTAAGGATDLPLPPAPQSAATEAPAAAAEQPPTDVNPEASPEAAPTAGAGQAPPDTQVPGTKAPGAAAVNRVVKPAVPRSAQPSNTPQVEATRRPDPTATVGGEPEPADISAMTAVPEASRSWTNANEVDRSVRLQLERSVDLGVRVSGVPVDRVFLTVRDSRSGIKKLFKKSTDKMRFVAEFLLNCPKDGSRPKLHFEVELQKEGGGVLDRLSDSKNCEGHVRLSRDVATSNLDEARKVRIHVRSAN